MLYRLAAGVLSLWIFFFSGLGLVLCKKETKFAKRALRCWNVTCMWSWLCFFLFPCSRYSWSGQPLFLTCPTSEVTELPACSHCGAQRTFEFQLMPALVSMLRSADLGNKLFINLSLWIYSTKLELFLNERLFCFTY